MREKIIGTSPRLGLVPDPTFDFKASDELIRELAIPGKGIQGIRDRLLMIFGQERRIDGTSSILKPFSPEGAREFIRTKLAWSLASLMTFHVECQNGAFVVTPDGLASGLAFLLAQYLRREKYIDEDPLGLDGTLISGEWNQKFAENLRNWLRNSGGKWESTRAILELRPDGSIAFYPKVNDYIDPSTESPPGAA
ncbi:MAG: hypothetical protein ABII07_04695 [Patescibacteria group bacterium]|nr:hypothetical protein [Patescibacteria group bacterium]